MSVAYFFGATLYMVRK